MARAQAQAQVQVLHPPDGVDRQARFRPLADPLVLLGPVDP